MNWYKKYKQASHWDEEKQKWAMDPYDFGYDPKEEGDYKIFTYYINLDERGIFYADVRDENEETVWEEKIEPYDEDTLNIFEAGYMKHKDDLIGLKDYLVGLGIMKEEDELKKSN